MAIQLIFLYLLLGLAAGAFSGVIGIGGGIILVPALVLLAGFSQHMAQGTTLAIMVPPVGILAALSYYKHGYVDLKVAIIVALGFVIGGLFGAQTAIKLSEQTLSKIFGVVLLLVSIKMLLNGKS